MVWGAGYSVKACFWRLKRLINDRNGQAVFAELRYIGVKITVSHSTRSK